MKEKCEGCGCNLNYSCAQDGSGYGCVFAIGPNMIEALQIQQALLHGDSELLSQKCLMLGKKCSAGAAIKLLEPPAVKA